MNESALLAEQFEANRAHLRAVAYRMLGSLSEADDAVQESWIRLSGADSSEVDNLTGWLTTVVGRVCLDMLRTRKSRREDPVGSRMPEPIVSAEDESNPEHEALVADSVGFALLIVLEALSPPERLALVLHDMFGVPFDEIASIVGRSPDAARQLASRARRRVRGAPAPDVGIKRQREVVDAFLDAARGGDMEALMKVLDPDVVVRVDRGPLPPRKLHGADAVAKEALTGAGAQFRRFARPALVNGAAGFVLVPRGRPTVVVAFTVAGGRIVEVDILADPGRVRELDLTFLDD